MNGDLWIVVPNWDKFQHYSDRTPPWIKLYLELEHKPEWLALNDTARGLLVRIWVAFAASRGVLHLSLVQKQDWSRYHAGHLESLNHAGFIVLSASKPLALEKRRVEKKELGAGASKNGPTSAVSRLPFSTAERPPAYHVIETMIRNGVIADDVDLTAEINGYQLPEHQAAELLEMLHAQG